MENDYGAYYLLIEVNDDSELVTEYNNAEAARKAAHLSEQSNPNGTRRLFKMLPGNDPIEVMI